MFYYRERKSSTLKRTRYWPSDRPRATSWSYATTFTLCARLYDLVATDPTLAVHARFVTGKDIHHGAQRRQFTSHSIAVG